MIGLQSGYSLSTSQFADVDDNLCGGLGVVEILLAHTLWERFLNSCCTANRQAYELTDRRPHHRRRRHHHRYYSHSLLV